MPKQIVQQLLRSKQTVFSVKELALLLRTIEPASLIKRLHYYVQKGELYHIRRGLYALDKDYNRLEVATKIYTPSYISFESVLMPAGVIFQYYSQIFVATYQSLEIVCDHQSYIFRRIKPVILTTGAGVAMREAYSIASVEELF
ncbi:type IV toxin-antitoxin system AbiEi family antitoxin domain-containing protein [Candidatus Dependentiae bacterium]|nr:type IV toxin-antitoxin system AbiEi family antitoxin domain-containing protein [Candidatus Dependentiae bacterium]